MLVLTLYHRVCVIPLVDTIPYERADIDFESEVLEEPMVNPNGPAVLNINVAQGVYFI